MDQRQAVGGGGGFRPALKRLSPCLGLLIVAPWLGVSWPAAAEKTVILVRHAEKRAEGKDPELSDSGRLRAARLAEALRDAGVTAILTSDARRTIRTAEPAAKANGLAARVVKAGDAAETVKEIDAAPADAVVLVVGHSNTLPEILAKLGAPAKVAIDDGDFGNLFVVVRSPGKVPTVVRLRY